MWPARTNDEAELLSLFVASAGNVRTVSHLLRDLFASFPDQPELAGEIRDCEHAGDEIARDIFCEAARRGSRAAQLEPADVHALTVALDDVVDYADEAADQLGLYGVEAPIEPAQQIAAVLAETSDVVADTLTLLRDGEDLSARLGEIHRLEDDADRIVRAAVASLFAAGIDPMVVIRWKDILETLESAVDACESVANVLEGIALKRANGRHA